MKSSNFPFCAFCDNSEPHLASSIKKFSFQMSSSPLGGVKKKHASSGALVK